MTNLIFDGNYLFYKTLFAIKPSDKAISVDKPFLSSERDQESFIKKISMDMAFAIRHFDNPTRIIFTIDDKSWRGDVHIEENEGYKSTRSKDTKIDWDSFYKMMYTFADIIQKKGIIVSQINRAEGDDLMFYWSKLFYIKRENCVIITGDKDLHQLVKFNDNNYVIVFDNNSQRRAIYAQEGFKEWAAKEEEVDLFATETYTNTSKDLIQDAINKINVVELNPDKFILEKILIGDDGDAVPTLYSWPTKNGKSMNRITPKRANEIINYANNLVGEFITIKNMLEYHIQLTEGIKYVTKVKDIDPEKIKERLERNATLMWLHNSTIPKEIFEDFKNHAKEFYYKETLGARTYSKNMLIEGSKYDKPAGSFTDSIFGQLDKKK